MGYTPPPLEVRKVASGWSIYGSSLATGDSIRLYGNLTDVRPNIAINGNANLELQLPSGATTQFYDNGALCGYIYLVDATNFGIVTTSNKNLALLPNGTGMVKFGTYDATAALASTGFIPILDAAGNTRKLMVQA